MAAARFHEATMSQNSEFAPAGDEPHEHSNEEWAELMARTIAHLAAQLTVTQIRLRALAGVLADQAGLDAGLVQRRVAEIANADAGDYLRENLGDALAEVIDADALAADLVSYLSDEA